MDAIHCHLDTAATMVELAGGNVPPEWDGQSFADSLRDGMDQGREYTVMSHMTGTCQRSVRFGDYLYIRSYHDGYHNYPDRMLFDVKRDPHMLHDLAPTQPDLVGQGAVLLDDWLAQMLRTATHGQDPLWTVMQAGGPEHIRRGSIEGYLKRLESTGRSGCAQRLREKHPRAIPAAH